ncbi:hypothetical protein GOP47_0027450 [Adiantum capillus-veneris]|nr:hypothetical protein GOP47_0027450 [Adiantum capillus-veneris]
MVASCILLLSPRVCVGSLPKVFSAARVCAGKSVVALPRAGMDFRVLRGGVLRGRVPQEVCLLEAILKNECGTFWKVFCGVKLTVSSESIVSFCSKGGLGISSQPSFCLLPDVDEGIGGGASGCREAGGQLGGGAFHGGSGYCPPNEAAAVDGGGFEVVVELGADEGIGVSAATNIGEFGGSGTNLGFVSVDGEICPSADGGFGCATRPAGAVLCSIVERCDAGGLPMLDEEADSNIVPGFLVGYSDLEELLSAGDSGATKHKDNWARKKFDTWRKMSSVDCDTPLEKLDLRQLNEMLARFFVVNPIFKSTQNAILAAMRRSIAARVCKERKKASVIGVSLQQEILQDVDFRIQHGRGCQMRFAYFCMLHVSIRGGLELYKLERMMFSRGKDELGEYVRLCERASKNYKVDLMHFQPEHFRPAVTVRDDDVVLTFDQLMLHMPCIVEGDKNLLFLFLFSIVVTECR